MNVYEVSCGIYVFYTVAKNEDEAVKKVTREQNLLHLPFTAKGIDLDGYELVKKKVK